MTEVPGGQPASESFTEPVGEPIVGSVAEAPVPRTAPPTDLAPSPAARPSDVVIVTFLALTAALLDVISATAWLTNRDQLGDAPIYLAWVTLLVGLGTAALALMLFMGSRWAKLILATFMGFHIVVHALAWISVGPGYAVQAMIAILIATVVLILLFSRESNAYLTGVKK